MKKVFQSKLSHHQFQEANQMNLLKQSCMERKALWIANFVLKIAELKKQRESIDFY